MINLDNNTPWPVYYVHWMLGNNLAVGDKIVESTNSGDVSSLAWIHNGHLKVMLINKTPQTNTVTLSGINGPFTIQRLDSNNNGLKTETTSSNQISLNGYSVLLIAPQGTEISTPQQPTESSTQIPSTQTTQNQPTQTETSSLSASISAPTEAYVYSQVTFDGKNSYATDGYIRYYRWDFGDGTIEYGETVTHRYSRAGTYTVTLRVSDNNRQRDSVSQSITVSNQYSTSQTYSSSRTYSRRTSRRR